MEEQTPAARMPSLAQELLCAIFALSIEPKKQYQDRNYQAYYRRRNNQLAIYALVAKDWYDAASFLLLSHVTLEWRQSIVSPLLGTFERSPLLLSRVTSLHTTCTQVDDLVNEEEERFSLTTEFKKQQSNYGAGFFEEDGSDYDSENEGMFQEWATTECRKRVKNLPDYAWAEDIIKGWIVLRDVIPKFTNLQSLHLSTFYNFENTSQLEVELVPLPHLSKLCLEFLTLDVMYIILQATPSLTTLHVNFAPSSTPSSPQIQENFLGLSLTNLVYLRLEQMGAEYQATKCGEELLNLLRPTLIKLSLNGFIRFSTQFCGSGDLVGTFTELKEVYWGPMPLLTSYRYGTASDKSPLLNFLQSAPHLRHLYLFQDDMSSIITLELPNITHVTISLSTNLAVQRKTVSPFQYFLPKPLILSHMDTLPNLQVLRIGVGDGITDQGKVLEWEAEAKEAGVKLEIVQESWDLWNWETLQVRWKV